MPRSSAATPAGARALLLRRDEPALVYLVRRATARWRLRHASLALPARRRGDRWHLAYKGRRTYRDGRFETETGDLVVLVAPSTAGARVRFFAFADVRTAVQHAPRRAAPALEAVASSHELPRFRDRAPPRERAVHVGRLGAHRRPRRSRSSRTGCSRRFASLGYTGIELGPPGLLRRRPGEASASCSARTGSSSSARSRRCASSDEDGFREDLAFLDRTIEILAATGARGPVVLAGTRTTSGSRQPAGRSDARDGPEGRRLPARRRTGRARRRPRAGGRSRGGVPPAHGDVHRESRRGRGAPRRDRPGRSSDSRSTPVTPSSAAAIPSSSRGRRATGSRTSTSRTSTRAALARVRSR